MGVWTSREAEGGGALERSLCACDVPRILAPLVNFSILLLWGRLGFARAPNNPPIPPRSRG